MNKTFHYKDFNINININLSNFKDNTSKYNVNTRYYKLHVFCQGNSLINKGYNVSFDEDLEKVIKGVVKETKREIDFLLRHGLKEVLDTLKSLGFE